MLANPIQMDVHFPNFYIIAPLGVCTKLIIAACECCKIVTAVTTELRAGEVNTRNSCTKHTEGEWIEHPNEWVCQRKKVLYPIECIHEISMATTQRKGSLHLYLWISFIAFCGSSGISSLLEKILSFVGTNSTSE